LAGEESLQLFPLFSGNVQTAGMLRFAQHDRPCAQRVSSTTRAGEAEEREVSLAEAMQLFQRPANMEMQRTLGDGEASQGLTLLELASAE